VEPTSGTPNPTTPGGAGAPPGARLSRGRLGLLAEAPFRNLWLAGALSLAGSQVGRIGLILYLFRQYDSVPGLALLVVLETLPGVLIAPLAGTLVDRYDKRAVMVAADVARMLVLGAILLRPTLATIYVAAALHSVASAFFAPAKSAAVPLVVRRTQLPAANGLDQLAANGALVLGPILGAELLLGLGLAATLSLDILSYLASALLLLRVPVRSPEGGRQPAASTLADTRAGWSYMARHGLVLQLTVLFFVSLLCTGLWVPLAPFFIRDVLGGSQHILGLQIGLTGLGAAAGALLAPRVMRRFGGGATLLGALFAEALVMTVYSLLPSVAASSSLMCLWGLAVSMIVVPFYSILQEEVEERFLGRVFSVVRQSENVALVGAMGLAVMLEGQLPAQRIFLAAGLVYCALTAASSLTRGGRLLLATR
jgi:MFS family permease